jgi:zinc/manganese transport system permease protein
MLQVLDLLQRESVRNAFVGGTIVAIVTALVGYFVVLRAQAFASEALTDIGFAGATGAALLGMSSFVGMLVLTILSALGIGALGKRVRGRDIETGMVFSFALGLGVLFLSLYTQSSAQHSSTGTGILFGSLFAVSSQDILITLGSSVLILLVLSVLYRPLLFASVDPEVANARGVPVRLLSIVFLGLVGITTAQSILVVGVLLVSALLIAPAATALNLTYQPRTTLLLAALLSLAFTWGGLLLALLTPYPVSFYITALSALAFFGSEVVRRKRAPRRQRVQPCCNREEKSVPIA